jgi:hypothetical protein
VLAVFVLAWGAWTGSTAPANDESPRTAVTPPPSVVVPDEPDLDPADVAPGGPFAGADLPGELRDARRQIARGHGLSDDGVSALDAYHRRHPTDARASLLLARSARFHGAWSDVVAHYVDAYDADASAIGFAPMLGDLVRASGEDTAGAAASEAVVRIFGARAVGAVDARIDELAPGPERDRLTALRRRLDGL